MIPRRPLLLAALFAAFSGLAPAPGAVPEDGGAPWDDAIRDSFATLPVQDRGRVKPVDSLAGLKLLTYNGKRTLKLAAGGRIDRVSWILECLFYPEEARRWPCFRVQSDAVLTAIDLEAKGKRAWYSYAELAPARDRLFEQAARHAGVEAADLRPTESQLLKLAGDLRDFEELTLTCAGLRQSFSAGGSARVAEVLAEGSPTPLASLLERAAELRMLNEELGGEEGPDHAALQALLGEIDHAIGAGQGGLALLPPAAGAADGERWWTVSDLVLAAFDGHFDLGRHLPLLRSLERMARAPGDRAAFQAELAAFHTGVVDLAAERGEYGRIPLEVRLNRFRPFTNALVLFLLGFVLTALGWLLPGVRALRWGVWGTTGLATLLVAAGITMRCIIRQRPPVVSLYDTILFITGCMVLVSLILERLTRQNLALSLATILGAAGMFLAGRYELKEVASAGDTMASVVAVLDTNYYLAIHVTTIAMGYAGGLLAGAIAHVWILGKLLGWRRADEAFYRSVARMTYGVVCFSLLFSIFGTIMGGIWANDSWGRFWGWDPKENGALLICLWELLIIHARLGGYIRDRGLAVSAVLGGVVVSASWWGVNLLSVGLHSYGFTSGVALTLFVLWGIEAVVVALAGVEALLHPRAAGETAA
ncbi:MAG: cytochrome c biogenesis protein CcsA [Planctomycetota bacterium]